MRTIADDPFICEPDPEFPGWYTWHLADTSRFNEQGVGRMILRSEGKSSARLQMFPERKHSNLHNNVHGGATLAFIDTALFAGARMVLGGDVANSVTLDLTCQFVGSGKVGQPLDAVVEVLKETGRLVFARGLVEQDGHLVASFTGTLRKPSKR